MKEYSPRVESLINFIEKNASKLDSKGIINYIFNRYYKELNIPFNNSEYTFIILHIKTPILREFFDDLSYDYNQTLSLFGKAKDERLKLDYSLNLSIEGKKSFLNPSFSFLSEFDENGYYIHNNKIPSVKILVPKVPFKKVKSTLRGLRGKHISESNTCCMCARKFKQGWKYQTGDGILYLCEKCKSKVKDRGLLHIIYTPMKG